MKTLFLCLISLSVFGCMTSVVPEQPHSTIYKGYHLQGGVKEPTYPPEGLINCWVQPPDDEYWYPCPQRTDEELGQHGH